MKKWDDHEVHQGIDALEETAFTADDLFDDSLSFHCFSCSRVRVVVVVPDSTSGCILRYTEGCRACGACCWYGYSIPVCQVLLCRYYCCSESQALYLSGTSVVVHSFGHCGEGREGRGAVERSLSLPGKLLETGAVGRYRGAKTSVLQL